MVRLKGNLVDESSDKFIYLADRPEFIPVLAEWFYEEWGRNNPGFTVESIEGKLRQRLNRNQVPLVLVLLREGSPIASASLKIKELETHPQYLHWLGSVYVLEDYRGGGIGTQLVKQALSEARRVGVRELYLYTRNRVRFYTRLGWISIERPSYHGRTVIIMMQNLSVEKGKSTNET
jgi:N-acetylglutamate synthase-like GNAT family acetyltransferase